MKILHINKFFDLHGGAEVYMLDLMRRQEMEGHEVHAFSTRSPGNVASEDAARFVTRGDLTKREGVVKDAKTALRFLWNREAKRSIEQQLDELKPDVVHVHNIYHHLSTSVLAPIRARRIPCVQTLHDLKLACPNYRMFTEGSPCARCKGGRYEQAIIHRCLATAFLPNVLAAVEMGMTKVVQSYERTMQTFICPSQFMLDKMKEWGEPPSKLQVVRMPVARAARPARRDGGYLLMVGALRPDKGYEFLIRAAAAVPSLRIKIAGRGPDEARLRSLIAELNVSHVELVGFQRGAELEALYDGAIGFVACPIGYENAPLSVIDAMAHGLPLLVSDFGGLREMVIEGENGYRIPRVDHAGWVKALKAFVSMPAADQESMSRASFEMAAAHYPTWLEHLRQIERIYEDAGAMRTLSQP